MPQHDFTNDRYGGANVLAVDEVDCRAAAERHAAAWSFSGRVAHSGMAEELYMRCMAARGWREAAYRQPLPSIPSPAPESAAQPLRLGGNAGWMPPQGFTVLAASPALAQEGFMPTWRLTGPDGLVMSVQEQRLAKGDFAASPFILPPTLRIYDRGGPARDTTAWAAFFGFSGEAMQAGFGAYLRIAEGHRLVITAIGPMPMAEAETPPGLALSQGQQQHMEHMMTFLTEWLAQAVVSR